MLAERESLIAEGAPSATYTSDEFSLDGLDKHVVGNLIQRAGNMQYVERELRELDIEEPGLVASLFPEELDGERMPHPAIQLQERRLRAARAIETFMSEPAKGAYMIGNLFSIPLSSFAGLRASLVGPPINWSPTYQPIYPLALMRGRTREWERLMKAEDSIEYEDPINVGCAVTHTPAGNPTVEYIVNSKSKIYPTWIRTEYYTIDIMQWAAQLTKTVVDKQRHFRQELDKAVDDLFIVLFDAAVPDGSTIKDPVDATINHPTHTITDNTGALTFDNYKTGARYLVHTDSTGKDHNAPPGLAMVDPLSIFSLEDEGTKEWETQTVEWFNNNDFGIDYTRSPVVNRITPKGYTLARNPRATSTRHVRGFAEKEFVGYYVPVSFQGKRTWVRTVQMVGGDVAMGQLKNTNMPPGFQFQIGAFECFALTIPGFLHLWKIVQT